MAEPEIQKKKSVWGRVLKCALRSPFNTVFILLLVYFSARAFVFSQTFTDKVAFFAVIGVWVLFFIAKQIFLFLVLMLLLGGGAYLYYNYTHQEAKQCEENGGYWNTNTQICEEKKSSWERLKIFWERNQQKYSKQQKERNEK